MLSKLYVAGLSICILLVPIQAFHRTLNVASQKSRDPIAQTNIPYPILRGNKNTPLFTTMLPSIPPCSWNVHHSQTDRH